MATTLLHPYSTSPPSTPASSASPRTHVRHSRLPDDKKYIRLLEILHAERSDTTKVRCEISAWPVDRAPSYHAISYAWGDARETSVIIVNDQEMQVGQNCQYALRQAHCHGGSRYHWVDAICVDQANLTEKSKQVAMMGDVYRRAGHVLACVGGHADDSPLLCRKIRKQQRMSRSLAAASLKMCHKPEWMVKVPFLLLRLGYWARWERDFQRALVAFSERPYFSRLWVAQELHQGSSVSFLCGYDEIGDRALFSEMVLLHAVKDLHRHSYRVLYPSLSDPGPRMSPTERGIRACIQMVALALSSTPFELSQILTGVIGLRCQEPRDHVFAILSMVDWDSRNITRIKPDYNETEINIALQVLEKVMQSLQGPGTEEAVKIREFDNVAHALVRGLCSNPQSSGVSGAIEARRRPVQQNAYCSTQGVKRADTMGKWRTRGWMGCRIPNADILDGVATISTDILPRSPNILVFLPEGALPGDWLLWHELIDDGDGVMLVVRDGAEGRLSILGSAIASSNIRPKPHALFDVFFDLEDALVWIAAKFSIPILTTTDAWKRDFVRTRLCKAAGSSYTILHRNFEDEHALVVELGLT